MDPVRALQHALYRLAKADPGRRIYPLRDKVDRRDVSAWAWVAVRRNDGEPGIDGTTLADAEEYGIERLLDELAEDLRNGRWRPLSIPPVRDRIVQAALKIVLEPIFHRSPARYES